jgi:membrane-associated phospholipid phosphatase
MHFLSDVIAGMLLGLCSLAICLVILGRPPTDSAIIEERNSVDDDDV